MSPAALRHIISIDPIEDRYRKIYPLTIFTKTAQLYMVAMLPVGLITRIAASLSEIYTEQTWPTVLGTAVGLTIVATVILAVIYPICYLIDSMTSNQTKTLGIFGGLLFMYGLFHFLFLSDTWERFTDPFDRVPVPPPLLLAVLLICVSISAVYSIHLIWCTGRGAIQVWIAKPPERLVFRDLPLALPRMQKIMYRLFALPALFRFVTESRTRGTQILLLSIFTSSIFFLTTLGIIRLPSDAYEVLGTSFQMCSVLRPEWLDSVPWAKSVPGLECLLATLDLLPRNLDLFDTQTWIATLMLPLAWLARGYIRRLTRFSLERLQRVDRRQPILFLRAFKDDQVRLRPARIALMARILELGRSRTTLDQLLLEEATPYGPVVAIGNPTDQYPPYGAARGYFDDKTWQEAVAELARNPQFVVICLDETQGIRWEVEHLFSNQHMTKTLFLLHPRFAAADTNEACIGRCVDEPGLEPSILGAASRQAGQAPVLGFYYTDDRSIVIVRSSTFSRFAYLLALRMFMRRVPPPAPS